MKIHVPAHKTSQLDVLYMMYKAAKISNYLYQKTYYFQ